MATASSTRDSATLRRNRCRLVKVPFALVLVPALFTRGIATATVSCGALFLSPTPGRQFQRLDTINVTYQSSLEHPTLSCLCGEPGRATEKFRIDHATSSGSALVSLNFSSTDPCWFHLSVDVRECGDDSPSFVLRQDGRPESAQPITDNVLSPPAHTTATIAPPVPKIELRNPAPASNAGNTSALAAEGPPHADQDVGVGVKAGLGIGITLFCLAAGAMAAFLYFRRKKRNGGKDHLRDIFDHERRHGRDAAGRPTTRGGAESVTSGRSNEPLCPMPVDDGFPGSTGFYGDAPSLHSTDAHSTYGGPSPSVSHAGTYWTDRDELYAARLKSLPNHIPTSYGPNPVTPTLTPRPSSRVDLNVRAGSVSVDSREDIPPMPLIPTDYTNYVPPVSSLHDPSPSPPRKAAIPIVVSYGPNRVTPTPAITSPTVPPDETIFKRHKELPAPQRQYSWELDDQIEPMAASTMGPLPPYETADRYRLWEEGAIKTLEEPQAEAELPPTKDGFYHGYGSDVVEYELPGTAAQSQPQLPHNPHGETYKRHAEARGPRGPGEIDEQKFLLLPEMMNLRAQKVKKKQTRDEGQGEEYDLGERSR